MLLYVAIFLVCLILPLQTVEAYGYESIDDRPPIVNDLGLARYLLYFATAAEMVFGVCYLRDKSMGNIGWVTGSSLFLGIFLTFVAFVRIPMGTDFYRGRHIVLYDPWMAPAGIGLLLLTLILLVVSALRSPRAA